MVFIVTYDLITPGQNYEALLKEIKSYKAWAKLGGSSYLVETDSTAVAIRDKLGKVLDSGDKLYVGVVTAPAAWRGLSEDVSKWIQEHLQ